MDEPDSFAEKIAYWRSNGLHLGVGREPRRAEHDGKKIVEKVNEIDGSMSGYETHHPDGRMDLTITPRTPRWGVDVSEFGSGSINASPN